MKKPHISFANGFWEVLWPELTPENLDEVMETWGWVLRMNGLYSVSDAPAPTHEYVDPMSGCDCASECKAGCPRWTKWCRDLEEECRAGYNE